MKVIVADKISDRGVKLLKEQPGWNVVMTTKDSLNVEIADADALIVRSATKVTAELLDRAKKLRAVGRAGVGVDNIELDEATKRGVLVMSTPGGSSVSVAEHTFALLISLHTAVSPQTRDMINAGSIAKMKKGVRIINAARGELINEADLAAAIKSGHVAGAALDVFAEEPPKNCPLIGLPNVITTPHVAGSTAEAQEELGTQVALQIRDYLVEGVIRNAVNLPALSPDQYRRVRPYLELAERLGSLVSQAAGTRPARIRIRYAGEVAEVGTHLLRSAVLAGVLNAVLDEKVNVVNAPAVAAARGLTVEEETHRREHGFPNTLEVSALPEKTGSAPGFTAEGTVLHDGSPRVLHIEGIPLEAQLEGTILYLRNRDEPGVIGQIGTTLGRLGVNIATFALGRREAQSGADAVSLVRLDGKVSPAILEPIRAIPAITEAKLLHLR